MVCDLEEKLKKEKEEADYLNHIIYWLNRQIDELKDKLKEADE